MIFGTDEFFIDEKGKRWQRCICNSKQPGSPFVPLVTVFADEGNNYIIDGFDDFDARMVGQGKDLMVMMHPKGTVVVLEEKPC